MSLVPMEQTFGHGQTESFLLTDPAPVIAQMPTMKIKGRGKNAHTVAYRPAIRLADQTRAARLRDLGFTNLAQAETQALPIEFARVLYPKLEDESYELWNKFLPTRYAMKDFVYDSVPDEALGHIESAKQLGCFVRIDVWTPEGNDLKGRRERSRFARQERRRVLIRSIDPMAVGVITDFSGREHFFSIVRWGESLLPIEKIKAYVAKVDRQEKLRDGLDRIGDIGAAIIPQRRFR